MRFNRSRRGTSAIEYAILMPVYLVVTLGMLEFGLFFGQEPILDSAARACARTSAYTADAAAMDAAGQAAADNVLTSYKSVLLFDQNAVQYAHLNDNTVSAPLITCTLNVPYSSITRLSYITHPNGLQASSTFRSEYWR